jgi:hypothetical protein
MFRIKKKCLDSDKESPRKYPNNEFRNTSNEIVIQNNLFMIFLDFLVIAL